MRRLVLPVALFAATLAASCGGGGSAPIAAVDPFGGAMRASLGRCVGFTLVSGANDVRFGDDVRVDVGPLTSVPVVRLDATHVRVGDPDNDGGRCFFTPLFVAPGMWDVTASSGGKRWTLHAALRMDPAVVTDLGVVAHDRVWAPPSQAVVASAGAFTFEAPFDADVYRVTLPDDYHVYAHVDFFARGPGALVPEMLFWEPSHPEADVARGGLALVFPQGGTNYVVVRDRAGQGGPGKSYRLSLVGDELGTTGDADDCDGAPPITPRGYHVDYDSLHADLDPDGACTDSIYGDPIVAPGNDAVWTVTIPAGQELRVATYDDHIDNVTYLLPLSDRSGPGGRCTPHPHDCVAAAHHFGGGNTNVLVWKNDGATDQTFLLVHDSAVVEHEDVGSFLVNVELFPLAETGSD